MLERLLQPYRDDVRALFMDVRSNVLQVAPDATELVYDSYNAVAAAYSFTGRLKEAFCHIAAYSGHVNLGFNRGVELSDPAGILQGSGKWIRHVRITSRADIARPEVAALLRQAVAQAPR